VKFKPVRGAGNRCHKRRPPDCAHQQEEMPPVIGIDHQAFERHADKGRA
jgi:hypothetical protein